MHNINFKIEIKLLGQAINSKILTVRVAFFQAECFALA